jgi:hypothetical protein
MDRSLETRKHRSRTLPSVQYRSARSVMLTSLRPAASMQWIAARSAGDKLYASLLSLDRLKYLEKLAPYERLVLKHDSREADLQ